MGIFVVSFAESEKTKNPYFWDMEKLGIPVKMTHVQNSPVLTDVNMREYGETGVHVPCG